MTAADTACAQTRLAALAYYEAALNNPADIPAITPDRDALAEVLAGLTSLLDTMIVSLAPLMDTDRAGVVDLARRACLGVIASES